MAKKGESPVRGTKAAFDSTQALSAVERERAQDSKNYTILMIEDDSALAEMYRIKLEANGFNVVVLTDGKFGLKAIKDQHPDLVLLDILMPGKDGFDVLAEKSKCPIPEVRNTPIIVLTNLASPDDQAEGKCLGAADWWIKAYNTPAEVAAKVKNFLHAKNS